MHDSTTNQLVRRSLSDRLGHLYRQGRVLRRLMRLLDDADRLGLPLTTAEHLPIPEARHLNKKELHHE
jgi:hypothetical protein